MVGTVSKASLAPLQKKKKNYNPSNEFACRFYFMVTPSFGLRVHLWGSTQALTLAIDNPPHLGPGPAFGLHPSAQAEGRKSNAEMQPCLWLIGVHACHDSIKQTCEYGSHACHVCMYVCMYVRRYACMHACMHACLSVCMHACMRACVYVCMCLLYAFTFMYVCT